MMGEEQTGDLCPECARRERENQSLLTQVLHAKAQAVLREERLEEALAEREALAQENETLKGEYEYLRQAHLQVAIERDQLRVQCKSLGEEKERLHEELQKAEPYRKRFYDAHAALSISTSRQIRACIQRDELRRVLRGKR